MIQLMKRYKFWFFIGFLIFAIQIYLYYNIPLNNIKTGYLVNKISDKVYNVKKQLKKSIPKQSATSQHDEDSNTNINQKSKSTNDIGHSGYLKDLKFTPKCDISKMKETLSAVQRATSQECKEHIINVACEIKLGTFYPAELENYCPSGNYIANRSIGCYKDDKKFRLLPGYYTNFKETNSPKKCIQICLQSGFLYAGVQYSTECFCGNTEPPVDSKLPDSSCNMPCSADPKSSCGGYFTINIYETGIAKFSPQIAEAQTKNDDKQVRVVFLLTLNGRALRQVYRLLKSLYSVDNFYYIHVDSRQDYLYRELLKLESTFPNIRLSRKRFSTIWGGASLLEMLLSCMQDLLKMDWQWDFVLNLSESDFPIKPIDRLIAFLTANRHKNFVKSHGREVQRFIQKQGLDKTFVECDTHMWRIGDRNLPSGIQIDGGSDWVCLSRNFVEYVTAPEKDALIEGLLKIFQHTLLPAESFFHTAIRNSDFCATYIDNNLHITNWKRKLGCKCQYKHVVDWCGCSPNDFKPDDWPRLQATELKQLFFGRKFEPVINQIVLLQLEEWLYGPYPLDYSNLNSYWQSLYHHMDTSPTPNVALLTVAGSLMRINSKSNQMHQFYETLRVLEITDYWENDIYRGFLVKHEAKISVNLTVELETWCRPNQLAQVSKSIKLAKKIMQLEVSTDFDQKELVSRNFAKIIGPKAEPVLILKLTGSSSKVDNTTVNFTVLWIDPTEQVMEVGELHIEDITITSINFSKATLKHPLSTGIWTVKILHKKSLIGLTKFLVTPSIDDTKETLVKPNIDSNISSIKSQLNHNLDKLIAQFYIIKDTCISYSHKNIRDIVGSYLSADYNGKKFHKFIECKKTMWSSMSYDPKSELISNNANGSLL